MVAKGSQIKKRQRRSRLPETKQSEVVARKLSGQSERKISRDTGISRKAIARITTGSEYQEIIQRYRREALELVPDSLKVIKQALAETLNPLDDPEFEPEKFEKITVIDGKDLHKKLNDAFKRGYRQGLKSGADGLKAALGSMSGTNVFTSRQHVEVEAGGKLDGMSPDEVNGRIRELEKRKKELAALE